MDNRPPLIRQKIYTQKCNWAVDRFIIIFIAFCFNNSTSTVDKFFFSFTALTRTCEHKKT